MLTAIPHLLPETLRRMSSQQAEQASRLHFLQRALPLSFSQARAADRIPQRYLTMTDTSSTTPSTAPQTAGQAEQAKQLRLLPARVWTTQALSAFQTEQLHGTALQSLSAREHLPQAASSASLQMSSMTADLPSRASSSLSSIPTVPIPSTLR